MSEYGPCRAVFDLWTERHAACKPRLWLQRTLFVIGSAGLVDFLSIAVLHPGQPLVQPSRLVESVHRSWCEADPQGIAQLMQHMGLGGWPALRAGVDYGSTDPDEMAAIARTWCGACAVGSCDAVAPFAMPNLFDVDSVTRTGHSTAFRYNYQLEALEFVRTGSYPARHAIPPPYLIFHRTEWPEEAMGRFTLVPATHSQYLLDCGFASRPPQRSRSLRTAAPRSSELRRGLIFRVDW